MSEHIKPGLDNKQKLNKIVTDEIKVSEAIKSLIVSHTGAVNDTDANTLSDDLQKTVERIVSNQIDNLETPVDEIERIARNKPDYLRNVVLSGRVKNGLPAYLTTHEFFNTEHEWPHVMGVYGSVTTSSNYSTDYTGVRALSNQIVPTTYYWGTTNGIKTGIWEYTFKIPRIITGIFYTSQNTEYSPGIYQIQGWDGSNWNDLYICDRKRRILGSAGIGKEFGRTLWFTNNTTAYQKIRFNIESVSGTGAYLDIKAIRFFEAVHDNLNSDDAVLKASPTEPFVASIARGKLEDKIVGLSSDVVIPGSKLTEMSRNYCYLVPETEDGNCPDYVNVNKSIKLPGTPTYLAVDSRKIQYCSEDELKRRCQLLLQSTELTDRTLAANEMLTYQGSQGEAIRRIITNGVSLKADKKYRGAQASYEFTTDSSCIAVDRATLNTAFKEPMAQNQPGSRDFTIECDLMYYNVTQAAEDVNRIIFTSGAANGNNGFWVFYNHRMGQIRIWINNQWAYTVPYVFDTEWHHLTITKSDVKLFFHIDGKCIGFYDVCPPIKSLDSPYGFGINSGYSQSSWKGSMANLRYVIGYCAYQNEDYTVSTLHKSHPIIDKTLWWNPNLKVVQQWDATTESWVDAPMLPIGHIDTTYKRHLHSEEPRGSHNNTQDMYNIKNITTSGFHSGNYPAQNIFNFADTTNSYLTATNNNTVDHYVKIDLYEPMAFDEMRIVAGYAGSGWLIDPCIFTWEGSNDDGVTWTKLIDRSTYIRDGSVTSFAHFLGATHHINGMKRFKYNESVKFSSYKITFLAKAAIAYHSTVNYTACRLQLPLKGSTPEITAVMSYVIGDTFTYGPVMITAGGTEYKIPAPFGGMPFNVDGYILEKNDFTGKKRKIGQSDTYSTTISHYGQGEILYFDDNSVNIVIAAHHVSLYSGVNWNSPTVASISSLGDMTIICRRKL